PRCGEQGLQGRAAHEERHRFGSPAPAGRLPEACRGVRGEGEVSGELSVGGCDPQGRSYLSFASFEDPDGNGWLLQEIRTRLPGREWKATPAPATDVATLVRLLREAATHHDGYEKTHSEHHWTSAWGCSPWSCPAGRSCSARGRSETGWATPSGASRRC